MTGGKLPSGKPSEVVAAGPDPEAFTRAHRELLADSAIQFDLPFYQQQQQPPPEWLTRLLRFLGAEHPVLNGMMWLIVGIAVLLILFLIARRLSGADWPWRSKTAAEEDWRPEEAPARALLSEADALAAQGRYSDAAHLLLFRSIEDIDSRRPALVRPALTSRDIAALPAIPDRPRGAFAKIAMMVERSLFARRPLDEGDWRHCRSAYEDFAFAEGWRG